jgi:ribosomal protein S10
VPFIKKKAQIVLKYSNIICKLTFRSSDHAHIKKEINCFITKWNNLKLKVYIRFKQTKLTILRAPFIHNKSREQFNSSLCIYIIYIQINYLGLKLFGFIDKYILKSLYSQNLKQISLKSKSYIFK